VPRNAKGSSCTAISSRANSLERLRCSEGKRENKGYLKVEGKDLNVSYKHLDGVSDLRSVL